jgi:pyruvate formate lyase activating enzyme
MHPPPVFTGRVARIDRVGARDGVGPRTIVVLKGCPLRCLWCDNPETQSPDPEVFLNKDACTACANCVEHCPEQAATLVDGAPVIDRSRCTVCGECLPFCTGSAREVTGRVMTVDEVLGAPDGNPDALPELGEVVISGGEPLLQPHFVLALIARCRQAGISVAVETCGLGNRPLLERIGALADSIRFDLKLFDSERHREATGHGNSGILSNIRILPTLPAEARIQFPLVPGVNDDPENVEAIGSFVREAGLSSVDIVPFRRSAMEKYERLGRPCPLPDTPCPSPATVEAVASRLRAAGLEVRVAEGL